MVRTRVYDPTACIVFQGTRERFGGLSNMAPGFPLLVNGVAVLTAEALYQACRFPHLPDAQRRIIDARSPMTAKRLAQALREDARPDWDAARVDVMRWCLRVKLAQHRRDFGGLLRETGGRPIVERSRRDGFWGAKADAGGKLAGRNVLGRLLMELRDALEADADDGLRTAPPPSIPDFLLLGDPIAAVSSGGASAGAEAGGSRQPSLL